VAATTTFGPTLVTLPGTYYGVHYHGIHLGDVLAFLLAAVWVVLGDPARSRKRDPDDVD
jgi:hypothetical protein